MRGGKFLVLCFGLRRKRLLWLTGALLAPAASVFAQDAQKLSLAGAVQLARTRSPLQRASSARIAGANARLRGANVLENPGLTIAAHGIGRDLTQLDSPLIITQTIPLGDKLRLRLHSARAERDAALATAAGTDNDIAFDAQTAYYEALLAENERQLAADALANAQAFAKAAEIQFTAGDVARSNVVRSQIELSRAEQALVVAQAASANRYAALRSLLGLPENAAVTLTDTLNYVPAVYTLPALQSLALRNRPDLQSAQRLRQAREADLRQARLLGTPDILLEARHNSQNFDTGNNSLRIGLVFPLFDYGRNRAERGAAQAAVQEQDALLTETERLARLDVETAFRTLEQNRKAVESFRVGRLDRSKELLDMTQIGYSHGANSYLELLDAQQVYRSEQIEYSRALAAWNEALAALQRAVGGKLP